MAKLDPRVNAFRSDLAAASLKGAVDAARFTEGRSAYAMRGVVPLRNAPNEEAGLDTELLYGERFTVYDEKDGWAWGQALLDNYVGYAKSCALFFGISQPTHRVCVPSTPLLPAPDVKRAARDLLPLNAKVGVVGAEKGFAEIEGGGFVYVKHLRSVSETRDDWVEAAEEFLRVPYLWGGKTVAGCDCSGLIQTALETAGIASPRDTDMMEAILGKSVALPDDLSGLRRGDLVFWKGHMGVMLDAKRFLHANAFHMQVAVEPLAGAVARIARVEGAVRAVKRLTKD